MSIVILGMFCFLSAGISEPIRADEAKPKENDKKREYPRRLKNREIHEWIVSAPGLLLYLPVKAVFKGIGNTIGYVDESRLVPRTKDFLTSDDGLRAVRPTYSSRKGAGFKLYQKNLVNEDSKLELLTTAGLRHRQNYQFSFKRLGLIDDKLYSSFALGYQKQPDEYFFGIGPRTHKDDESNFAHEHAFVSAVLGSSPINVLDLAASFRLENNTILGGKNTRIPSTTDQPEFSMLPGMESEIKMFGVGLVVNLDTRETRASTSTGPEIAINGGFFDQLEGDEYAFWKLSADLKLHIHLFYGRAVVFRVAGEMTEPLSDKAVPFYSLSEMGSRETIRGFERGRFRDLDKVLGSIEYKYPIWKTRQNSLMSFLFVDAGQVADDITRDIKWDDVRVGFGGGISLSGPEGDSLMLVLAKSKEQFRLYAVLN